MGGELVGQISAPARDPQSTGYVEHWALVAGEALLVRGRTVELVPNADASPAERRTIDSSPRGAAWETWSDEEVVEAPVTGRELLRWPGRPDLHAEMAEIVQLDAREEPSSTAGMGPVGWMLEWTGDDGKPVMQEWWLTRKYVYPAPSVPIRTILRTLDERGRSAAMQLDIAKRIAVELVPVKHEVARSVADAGAPAADRADLPHGGMAAGCHSTPSRGEGSGGRAALGSALMLVLAAWRRRRPDRG